ncbi:ribonuclease E/G [Gracilibacillus sp. Marseille-QA3620]
MDKILLDYQNGEKRLGIWRDGRLHVFHIERDGEGPYAGNLYAGIVREVVPGMNAAFVDIGLEKNAYLPFEETPRYQLSDGKPGVAYVRQGEKLLVRVVRDPQGTKGAKVSALIEISHPELVLIKGEHFVRTSKNASRQTADKWKGIALDHLREDEGVIVRTQLLEAGEGEFVNRLARLRERYEVLIQRADSVKAPGLVSGHNRMTQIVQKWTDGTSGECYTNSSEGVSLLKEAVSTDDWTISRAKSKIPLFEEHQAEADLEKAVKKIIWLSNGAYLLFERTEAMHVIDVNTGKFTGKHDQRRTMLETNLLAAKEVGRQVILRNLSGIIIVDFINMTSNADRKKVKEEMESALGRDLTRSVVVGFTELGLLQITRKKEGPDLYELMLDDCPRCHGNGHIQGNKAEWHELSRQLEGMRYVMDECIWIDADPEFFALLKERRKELEPHGKQVLFRQAAVEGNHRFVIRATGSVKELDERARRASSQQEGDSLLRLTLKED